MLGDVQLHGSILRWYYKQKELLQVNELKKLLQDYQDHCRQKEYSPVTQNHYCKIVDKFLNFLESRGINLSTDITAKHTSDYINTLLG